MNIPETLRDIADKLSEKINCNPNFIDIKDIKQGMVLQDWFYTEYKPEVGNYAKTSHTYKIIRVDANMVYIRFGDLPQIHIYIPENFNTCTLVSDTPPTKP